MNIRNLLYPIFHFMSIRHIHNNPPKYYLSHKSIRNNINKGIIDIWDLYNATSNYYNINNNIYTLEHIWPKSFLKNNLFSKYDLHNLAVTNGFYNVHRSNYKFSDYSPIIYSLYKLNNNMVTIQINDNTNLDIKKYNYKNSALKLFIPVESSRGEIARTILYMSNLYGNSNIDKIIDKKLLHKWSRNHPPTEREKLKNIQIFKLQGNKNPFINF